MPRNLVLAGLPSQELQVLSRHLQWQELERNRRLFGPGERIDYIYLPETCVVSLVIELPDGREVDGATIGYEGAVGVGGCFAHEHSYPRQMVQIQGGAHAIRQNLFMGLFESCPTLARRVSSFRDAFSAQMLQSIACNALHTLEERFARALLEINDRSASDEIALTHEQLAVTIGASRPSITLLVRSFEGAGLVRSRRGGLIIRDRAGLEQVACACHAMTCEVLERAGLRPRNPAMSDA